MTYGIILGAGSGLRMGLGKNKVLATLRGQTIISHAILAFDKMVDGLILVIKKEDDALIKAALEKTGLQSKINKVVYGGSTRQQSVLQGLLALPEEVERVLIHDGARPFVSKELIGRILCGLDQHQGVIPVVPVSDTIKEVNSFGQVVKTIPREELMAVQTPQGFHKDVLVRAYQEAAHQGFEATDDASLLERLGIAVSTVMGEMENVKLTTKTDLDFAKVLYQKLKGKKAEAEMPIIRIGQGYDVHRLVEGRPLILCGVKVIHEKGLLGHSDADVGTHALMDALLGAAGLGDIGSHFSDQSEQYKNISSLLLLEQTMALLEKEGYSVQNADVTLVAQAPKLKPYILEMKETLAYTMNISPTLINVKATTTEKLGFEGEGQGISAHCVCLLRRK